MPHLHGVIFDLDGTLIDSAPDLTMAINATLAEHGRRALTLIEVKQLVGDGIRATLVKAQAATGGIIDGTAGDKAGDPDQWVAAFNRHYYRLLPDAGQVYPHVRAALDTLRAAGIKLGICTNKQEAATLRLLDRLDLTPYFQCVAGVDTFKVHKPHPGHVQGVVDALDLKNENCAMVGDSPNDVLAAQGCGVAAIVVTQGYGSGMEQYGAAALIDGFDGLAGALRGIGFTF